MKPAITPLGIGDLKVTKQRLVRYVASEVAHIENVLARERRGREHRRLRQVEETLTLEHEREEENRRDLQSTERFEIEAESQRTITSETSLEAGLELSAGYGPVQLNAFAKFADNTSKEEADTNSTKYAKEVVEKTVSRVLERAREERRTRTLEEVEETNTHGFRNDSAEHVTGVYRWVDKVYRQKVVNYGKRLMYQFSVPEPAAFYIFAQRHHHENKVLPTKPPVPSIFGFGDGSPLIPSQISRVNYRSLVALSGATGVEPPPPASVILTTELSREIPTAAGGLPPPFAFTHEGITIPKGYWAVNGWYTRSLRAEVWATFNLIIGGDLKTRSAPAHFAPFVCNNSEGKLGVTGEGVGVHAFAVSVLLECQLTPEAFHTWQLATYQAIMNAYREQLLDYEERVAVTEIQQGVAIGGNNPLLNREMEKEELKRASLTLWAGGATDLADGVQDMATHSRPDLPPVLLRDNAVANATALDFFERAFDWRNMTYTLHPYFWGRESTWLDRASMKSTDPLLERFLKAGAATVVVPVQPSFTEAVLWYQLTGEIWTGGPVPELSSTDDPDAALYNSYLSEVEDETDLVDIDREVEIDKDDPDSWTVRLPTTLVWLQPGPELPDLEPEPDDKLVEE
ncbi:hypothetical protein HLK59_17675 [Streptomyces sp. S3(2020)]|uniref:hypothetical protein n=1 Tax=Streptomyces sp. S3(2020) TaxID=2732044 RepID=UPI0014894F63|nr:hypothetical protein [Streptomyces sp. S3(2020)]NNN32159.1 hypothetical protein [Streptomyces sp. S3(2020)]